MSWSQIQELLMIYWQRLQWYLTFAYDFLHKYVYDYDHLVRRFFDNDYHQVVRLKDEFWLNYRDAIERRGVLVSFGTIGLFGTLLKWYYDWNNRFNLIFDTKWSYTSLLLDFYAPRVVTLVETVWAVLNNLSLTSGNRIFDLTQNMFVNLFNMTFYDSVGLLEIFRRFRERLGLLVGVRSDRVEGIVGTNFTRLYEMIAGSYQRLNSLTTAESTNLYDILNKARPMIDMIARNKADQAMSGIHLFQQDFRIKIDEWSRLWSTLSFLYDGNKVFVIDWLREKVFPIASDPLGWLEAWLKELLLKRGESFFRWVFGV